MTDIYNWKDLIHKKDHYIMVPLNEYQMANLVDALSQVPDTGDWWGETLQIVVAAMDVLGIEKLQSNYGNVYTRGQIWNYNIRKDKNV